jgi:sulfhydrogenase subunit beta (sulfur reductase)
MTEAIDIGDTVVLDRIGLGALLEALADHGYRLLGPTIRDRAIVYDAVTAVSDLPEGWTDRQDGGSYRLERRGDRALFGYASTPQSWKQYLHPPTSTMWRAERRADGFTVRDTMEVPEKLAFIGVRSCDLHAIAIQDKVLRDGGFVDPSYAARRSNIFVVAVNCSEAGSTCFCVSMQSGPKASFGFDLALTELLDGGSHRFMVEVGSAAGAAFLARVPTSMASAADEAAAAAVVASTAAQMGRTMPAEDVPDLLRRNFDHPRWDEVAERCLTCGNCTMVCPTCFCTTMEDVTSLDGAATERVRRWDSCFTMDFSYLHGGSVRASPRSRYRQWMTL